MNIFKVVYNSFRNRTASEPPSMDILTELVSIFYLVAPIMGGTWVIFKNLNEYMGIYWSAIVKIVVGVAILFWFMYLFCRIKSGSYKYSKTVRSVSKAVTVLLIPVVLYVLLSNFVQLRPLSKKVIYGYLRNQMGVPIRNARLTIKKYNGDELSPPGDFTSDDNGYYSIKSDATIWRNSFLSISIDSCKAAIKIPLDTKYFWDSLGNITFNHTIDHCIYEK